MPSSQKKKQKTQSAEPESGGGPSSGVPTLVGELLAQCKAAKAYNPVKWWRRSLPRLKGLKVDYSLGPNGDAGDDED